MNRLLEFAGLVMVAWLLVLAFCWAAAHAAFQPGIVNPAVAPPQPPAPSQNPKTRHARASHRYVCAQAYKGAQLPATRENIMRGVCAVTG